MTKFCGLSSSLSLATLVLRGHYNCCSLPYGEENESETRDEYVKSIRIHVNKTPNNLKLTSSCLVLWTSKVNWWGWTPMATKCPPESGLIYVFSLDQRWRKRDKDGATDRERNFTKCRWSIKLEHIIVS